MNDSINDLYKKSFAEEINNSAEKLKNLGNQVKKLQPLINTYESYSMYEYHRTLIKDQTIPIYVQHMCKYYLDYLDYTEAEFTNDFAANYSQKIFELVMAKLLATNFSCKKRKGKQNEEPDIRFIFGENDYFLECTSVKTSLMDKFFISLTNFGAFYELCTLLQKLYEVEAQKRPNLSDKRWFYTPRYTLNCYLNNKEVQDCLRRHPEIANSHSDLTKALDDWVYVNRYAFLNYEKIISDDILKKLKKLFIEKTYSLNIEKEFVVKTIAKRVSQKLKKKYFLEDKHGIIAVSFGGTKHDTHYNSVFKELEPIAQGIATELKQNGSEENFTNFYALIIDTTWYNWFPEIVAKEFGIHFPVKARNTFHVIYNSNSPIKERIFDNIIGGKSLTFSV